MEERTRKNDIGGKRLTKTALLERSHQIMSLLVRISLARFPYGKPSHDDETSIPYWQDDALIQYERLMSDVFQEFDRLQADTEIAALPVAKTDVPKQERAFTLNLMNCNYDAWFNEEDSQSYDDEDFAWFKEEMGLSREELFRTVARAKEIVQHFKPNDEFVDLIYNSDHGDWSIYFNPVDATGRWSVHVCRHEEHLKEEVSKERDRSS